MYDDHEGDTDFHQHDESLDPGAMAEMEDDPEAAEDDHTGPLSWNFDEGNGECPNIVQTHLDLTLDVQHSRAALCARSKTKHVLPICSPSPEPEAEATATAQTARRQSFEPRAQAILNRTVTFYKANLTIKNAYPDKLMEKT